ncbi:MAG: biotin/lipoyl-binding protein, partial [Muribaculaceae bacterium]|nr:biotin/lipoyl-binding protein [Muribaculaceae bacterium]
ASKVSPLVKPQAPAAAPRTETGAKVISKTAAPAGPGTAVKSPLPGTIMSIKVSDGQAVKAGDTVCVLEAMKMENDIHCSTSGTVKKILVGVGDAILEGTDIMIIE